MKDISISAIADTLDRFRLMDDPYEWHDNEGVEARRILPNICSITNIAAPLFVSWKKS